MRVISYGFVNKKDCSCGPMPVSFIDKCHIRGQYFVPDSKITKGDGSCSNLMSVMSASFDLSPYDV